MATVATSTIDRAALPAGPVEVAAAGGGATATHRVGGVTPGDLAELMSTFNEVTSRLEATHAQLRGEVSRLTDELREAKARLRRSERLAELGEMAAGIAHEIRNPLGSIGLYSRMLAEDVSALDPEGSPDGPAATAVKIGESVRRLDAIVRDVLDFARELRVRPEPLPVEELLEAAIGSPRGGAGAGGFVLGEIEAGLVWCDRSLGLQALLNIVENARHAGGPVTLSSRRVGVRSSDGNTAPGVALVVRDAGPGVSPDVLERMFNPFFTTRNTGTGLGLAIVHRIVDAHAGCVVVENNTDRCPGEPGATVELRFPDRDPGPTPDLRAEAPTGEGAGAAETTQERLG